MKPKHKSRNTMQDAAPKVRRPPGSPTKSQLRAQAEAEARAHVAKWKTLASEAQATWRALDPAALARTEGNVHVLAGQVQLRYQISREEADRQVKAFFDKYMPAKPITAPAVTIAPAALAGVSVEPTSALSS